LAPEHQAQAIPAGGIVIDDENRMPVWVEWKFSHGRGRKSIYGKDSRTSHTHHTARQKIKREAVAPTRRALARGGGSMKDRLPHPRARLDGILRPPFQKGQIRTQNQALKELLKRRIVFERAGRITLGRHRTGMRGLAQASGAQAAAERG
jgi:hypothetical protein